MASSNSYPTLRGATRPATALVSPRWLLPLLPPGWLFGVIDRYLLVTSLMVIVFILLARKALIVLLIVAAPLAFVAYLLPNTEQWFQKWQKMFFALLVVFPVISAIFGASMLASHIVKKAAEATDDQTMGILAIGIAIIPLIMVPAVLKGSITAAGAIGATLKGMADKNTKRIGSEVSSTSKLGQLNKYRKTEGERRRALMQAGVYDGDNRNPLNWGRNASSRLSRAFNKSRISGGFGDRMSASGQQIAKKLDYEKIDDLKNQFNAESVRIDPSMKSREHPEDTMSSDEFLQIKFEEAIERGDSNATRALFTALQEQGQGGVERIQQSLAKSDIQQQFKNNPNTQHDLQEHILTRHADIKGSDSRIINWASTNKMAGDGKHINSLNDGQIATQTESSLLEAEANGTLTPDMAKRVLANPNATNNMKVKQRNVLERVARNAPGATPPQTIPGVNQANYTQSGGLYIPHGLNQPPNGNNGGNGNNNPPGTP